MNNALYRQTPVTFGLTPKRAIVRDGWPVVLAYEDEGPGPALIDLSHLPKWDLQSDALDTITPLGCPVPQEPGFCRLTLSLAVARLTPTRAAVWILDASRVPEPPSEGFTDITDGKLLLALQGADVFSIAEKLTAMDLQTPAVKVPFLLQGPICRRPGQALVLEKNGSNGCVLFNCSRAYAKDLVDAILAAGEAFGLQPSGEERFTQWLAHSHAANLQSWTA